MRRLLGILTLLALITTACGDDTPPTTSSTVATAAPTTTGPIATTSTAPPPAITPAPQGFTVTSPDGLVTLEVPPEAATEDPGVSIGILDPADYPPELAGAAANPNAVVYSLEPDGLGFTAPLRVTREIAIANFPGATDDDIPLITLVTTTADGSGFELLQNHELRREGDSVFVSAETTHFSPLIGLSEQVLIETRIVEAQDDFSRELSLDFRWVNGVPLEPPPTTALGGSFSGDGQEVSAVTSGATMRIRCLDGVEELEGQAAWRLLLDSTTDTSGAVGLSSAPILIGQPSADVVFDVLSHTTIRCVPVLGVEGPVQLTTHVDHPGGQDFVPGGDFRGGASALYGHLDRAIPGLLAGLIRDDDGDGAVSPTDIMFPPQPTTLSDGETRFAVPLFGFGEYFLYFLDGEALSGIDLFQTQVMVRDGATILVEGGAAPEDTAVPGIGGIPMLSGVFETEDTTEQEIEFLVLITPHIVESVDD